MEELIKGMGYGFRDLTYHSNGKWSCRLGFMFMKGIKGRKEFWGDTPIEALMYANEALNSLSTGQDDLTDS